DWGRPMRRRFAMPVIVGLLVAAVATPAAAAPTPIAPPGDLTVVAASARGAQLRWSPVTGATGYRVFWGDDPAFIEELADTTATSYLHDFLAPGHTYLYAVATRTRKGV